MYEKMLVPLDGSKVGEAALPYVEELVAKLATTANVEVTLLQVIPRLTHYVIAGEVGAQVPYTEKEMEMVKNRSMDYLEKAAQNLRSKGAIVRTRVVIGKAADEIIKVTQEINADLVAMSSHGRSGLSRWAFGSVTEKVLRAGNRPVLVVRAPKEDAKT